MWPDTRAHSVRSNWIRGWLRLDRCTEVSRVCPAGAVHGLALGRVEYQSHAILQPAPRPGVRCNFRCNLLAAHASAGIALLLGRGWILRPSRARPSAHWKPDS